ncbi:hypothetical protein CEXT_416671 [Caerostris extrusa]|uniref:Uncharacterized protein n=1 Tax=Caerostris extrusa TaxID=172846 RepID=A0AAV4N774_CAEEX|nr:hypothetical protein CEXT_416671 [Caerostris extrusa]
MSEVTKYPFISLLVNSVTITSETDSQKESPGKVDCLNASCPLQHRHLLHLQQKKKRRLGDDLNGRGRAVLLLCTQKRFGCANSKQLRCYKRSPVCDDKGTC